MDGWGYVKGYLLLGKCPCPLPPSQPTYRPIMHLHSFQVTTLSGRSVLSWEGNKELQGSALYQTSCPGFSAWHLLIELYLDIAGLRSPGSIDISTSLRSRTQLTLVSPLWDRIDRKHHFYFRFLRLAHSPQPGDKTIPIITHWLLQNWTYDLPLCFLLKKSETWVPLWAFLGIKFFNRSRKNQSTSPQKQQQEMKAYL